MGSASNVNAVRNMNSRERIKAIIGGQAAEQCGFWRGNPHPESWLAGG